MKPIQQKELVARWGCGAPIVSRLVKRGMPLTSIEDAEAWRNEHAKEGWGHKSPRARIKASAAEIAEVASRLLGENGGVPDGNAADNDNHAERAKKVERQIYALLMIATEAAKANLNQAGALPGLIRTHAQANANRLDAEVRWEKHKLALGDVAPVAELNAVLDAALEPLASQLRNFPRNVAPAANPADPAGAERAITAALNPILEQVAAALERAPLAVAPAHAA